jgi:3D (Asp-Asp-Asp) domain-containing protein
MWFLRENLPSIIFFTFGFIFCILFGPREKVYFDGPPDHKPCKEIHDTIILHDTIYLKKVNASYYNPTKGQCDDSPFHTADGTFLSKNKKNIVSLSRDLLKKYPFGSKIEVIFPKKLKGIYSVHDCMHKRFRNKIDFFTFGRINIRNVVIKYN